MPLLAGCPGVEKTLYLVETIIPWTAEWLIHYELCTQQVNGTAVVFIRGTGIMVGQADGLECRSSCMLEPDDRDLNCLRCSTRVERAQTLPWCVDGFYGFALLQESNHVLAEGHVGATALRLACRRSSVVTRATCTAGVPPLEQFCNYRAAANEFL